MKTPTNKRSTSKTHKTTRAVRGRAKKRNQLRILVAGLILACIAIASVITLNPFKSSLQRAQDSLRAAQASESAGKTADAIAHYKDALVKYQAAGDRAGEEGVKLQITYLESVNKRSPTSANVTP